MALSPLRVPTNDSAPRLSRPFRSAAGRRNAAISAMILPVMAILGLRYLARQAARFAAVFAIALAAALPALGRAPPPTRIP